MPSQKHQRSVKGGHWIQHPITMELIPKDQYERPTSRSLLISPCIEEFRSPIDGRIISDRKQLREHNKEHGVTDYRDYGDDYFSRKQKEREAVFSAKTAQANEERKRDFIEACKRNNA